MNRSTRAPEAVSLPDQQAVTVGAQFETTPFSELAKLLGLSKIRTTHCHPQSNKMVARTHRTLKATVRTKDAMT